MNLYLQRFSVLFPLVLLLVAVPVSMATAASTEPADKLSSRELAAAERDFNTFCGVCHGRDAKGRGPVADELKTSPPDLTRIAERAGGSFPAEAVYKKVEGLDMPLAHGTREMPIWGALFVRQAVGDGVLIEDAKTAARVATDRIRRLVKYLETIQE